MKDKIVVLTNKICLNIFIINCLLLSFSDGLFELNCVVPPLECPNINITFWLYTRAIENKPYEISVNDATTIKNAPWVKNAPIKILVHGYTGHKDFSPNTEIRPAYMKYCDYNIISVDYKELARERCYFDAARNSVLVGKCLAQLIDKLVLSYGFELPVFHLVGFSLGAHVVGSVSNFLTTGTLDRITALDPALPLFVTTDTQYKIDPSDAKYVDVLHTNVLARGKLEPCGHVDFYANGGHFQPGCPDGFDSSSSCSHNRAPQLYAESIATDVGFCAKKCSSWFLYYVLKLCNFFNSNEETAFFGEHVSKNASGLYFFDTNSEPPYSKGCA